MPISLIGSSSRRFSRYWWRDVLNPLNYWRALRAFWQRGRRGWAFCDVWNLDHYLAEVIAGSVAELRRSPALGVPFKYLPDVDDPSDADCENAADRWHADLDELVRRFAEIRDHDDNDFDQAKEKALPGKAREACALLGEHFLSLWD